MKWGTLPAGFSPESLSLAYGLADKTGTGKFAALYLDPSIAPPEPFPAVSCWGLPKSLWAFCEAGEKAAEAIVKEGTGVAGVPDLMGANFLDVYGDTRSRRFQALVSAWAPYAVLPVVQQHLAMLTNWYIDSWGKEKLSEWWQTREKSYQVMLSNKPRLREAMRDLLCAQWLYLADKETTNAIPPPPPPPASGGGLQLNLLLPPTVQKMPQYFALLYASLQPLAGGVSPQMIGPFATPQAATTAATQLAGLVSQLGGYAFGQPAALNPATNAWQWLSQGVAMMPQQKPANWGGW